MDYTEVLRSDDRSDSGVSSLRVGNYASGDERSGSRSSALSSTDETQQISHSLSSDFYKTSSTDRKTNVPSKPVCVWRDPDLIAESTVHQVQSIQHQSLLMSSHSSSPSPAVPPVGSPVTVGAQIHVPPSHPLQHLPPPGLYAHHPEAIWKQQFTSRTPATQNTIAEVERDRQERVFREHREVEVSEIINQHKGKEKLERERLERDKQMERERECHERIERERRATEQAVHKHFEESLRLAQHKHNLAPRWNIINSLPPPPEEARKRSEQEAVHQQQIVASERVRQEPHERYLPGIPRSASGFKVEYPPSGHSRVKQVSEKPMVHALPKAEPNFNVFGYPAYQPAGYLTLEGNKVKQEPPKTPLTSLASISVSKSALNLERDRDTLPNPPPLTSDLKSSVIVKNEGKSPLHHDSSKLARQHSPSPKHQMVSSPQMHFHKTGGYEFQPQPRAHVSPSHSPHHINSHHMALEAQNLVGKAQLSPHSQRQLPLPNSGEQRFKVAAMSPFPYAVPGVTYGPSNTKPKVSSPAPGHMYMKPSPSPQPLLHAPPPAHRTSLGYNSRLYPPKVQGAPPAPANRTPVHPASCQTQPLDLGVSNTRDEHSVSPKRKVGSSIPTGENSKRQRCDPPSGYGSLPHGLGHPLLTQSPGGLSYPMQPMLSRVGEPSPLIASAATTITTVVNTVAYCSPAMTMTTSLAAVTPVAERPMSVDNRPNSAGSTPVPSNQPCSSPLPLVTCSSPPAEDVNTPPCTPIKVSSVDSDKSNSPGPMRSQASYPVHKLKKAWLQRHSGEDGAEDNSVITGAGSCATPTVLTLTSSSSVSLSNKDCVSSLSDYPADSAETDLSGSIGKSRQTLAGNHKGSPILPISKGNSGVFINGHTSELPSSKPSVDDDSSSTNSDRELKTSRKRKPPKVKKKKGSSAAIRKAAAEELKRKRLAAMAASESSGSDKESATDKDSDNGATKKAANSKEPRKRGRRPKGSKFASHSESRAKKNQSQASAILRDPFQKPPVSQLKKTGEAFLQDGACFEVAPKLAKCRECRWTPNQRSKNTPNIFCRFYAFRKLRYTKNGQLAIAGFSDPHQDASEEDLRLWLPFSDSQPADLDLDVSRLILMQVGDQFCDLLQQESACPGIHMSEDKTIAWKRVVQGVREMCDVCETTLFNFHWACGKCGFVVCIDCYKGRKNGAVKVWSDSDKEGKDEYLWLSCTNRQPHEQEKLMLTQIIAGDSLLKLGKKSHEARALWGVPQYCGCDASKVVPSKEMKDAAKELLKNVFKSESMNGLLKLKEQNAASNGATKDDKNSLNWLAAVALSNEDDKMSSSDTELDEGDGNYSTLRELLIRPSHKPSNSRSSSPANTAPPTAKKSSVKTSRLDALDEVISSVIEHNAQRKEEASLDSKKSAPVLEHFVRRYKWFQKDRDPLPIRIMTLTDSTTMYPNLPHAWLCDGKLLRLTDPTHTENRRIFGDQWKRGQPVLVSDVSKLLDNSLWHPDSFARDFGDEKNDLINCMTGNLVPNQPMRKFWEGFEFFSRRLKDEHGNAMLLKLKDWPPGEDFAEMLPSRFKDLMRVLPMPEYTNRTGYLNLASRLPDCFVRPDLGPKMYNAYGSALHPSKGTTNLHLDISDAVNVMVYVGIPVDSDSDEHIKEAFRAIDEAGCDILTRRRVRDKGELPGALWHIYHSRDSDKIRDLLNKVSLERGCRLEPHHDPIHDQSWYLDSALRERLYKEYSVEGYAIVQCLGDAVFIPAGAPHQVRNLHNCIKVAEDFVSPENVSHCFHLTQEFRELSNEHTNHEDKLQIKNIIYHAVKDSIAVLSKFAGEQLKEKAPLLLEKGNASEECKEQITDSVNKDAEVPVDNTSTS